MDTKQIKLKFDKFILSDYFIILVSLFVLAMSFIDESALTISIALLILSLILVTQKETTALLPLLGLIYFALFTINPKYNLNWFFFLSVGVFLAAIIYYIIKNKPKIRMSTTLKAAIPYGLAFILGGIFSPQFNHDYPYYINIAIFFLIVVSFAFLCFIVSTIKIKNPDYIMKIIVAMGVIIVFQILLRLVFQEGFVEIIKQDRVILNWGIYNSIVTVFLFAIPACFYFGYKKIKFSALFIILGNIIGMTVFLTGSRAGMLGITAEVLFLDLAALKFAKNKFQTKVTIFSLIVIFFTAFLIIFLLNKNFILAMFNNFLTEGLHLNSRLRLWEISKEMFLQAPLFGAGFFHDYFEVLGGVVPFTRLSHNTFYQVLSSLGAFGFIALAVHIFFKFKVCCKKTLFHMTALVMFIGVELYGLIDNTYPNPYMLVPMLIVLLSIDSMEQDTAISAAKLLKS